MNVREFVSSRRARLWLLFLFVILLRFFLARRNPGFFCGDDVEILELVLSRIQGWSYAPFDLRCAFYPFVVIFPAMKFAFLFGMTDTWHLVLLGRTAVIVLSSLAIFPAYWIGQHLGTMRVAGWYAAVFVGSCGVLSKFSETALPRGVAAALILLAVWLLLSSEDKNPRLFAAASLVGIAAALRFSESTFILAGFLALTIERRFRHAVIFVLTAAVTALLVLAVSDLLFWGDPFHSSMAIIRFTILDRLSTRGYQPWWQYLRLLVRALQPAFLFFLFFSFQKRLRPLWVVAVIPVVLLSFLPHKELRYLVPVLPVFLVLSALGAFRLSRRLKLLWSKGRKGSWKLFSTCALLSLSILAQLLDGELKRPGDGCRFAAEIARGWNSGNIVCEQTWRCGGRLYFPKAAKITEFSPAIGLDAQAFKALLDDSSVAYIGLKVRTLERRPDTLREVSARGFSEFFLAECEDPEYRFFVRSEGCHSSIKTTPEAEKQDSG